ncbi:serine/threonine protein phosphatase 1 [Geothermobacter ehrlichii]|uniref:Serine/threonine protein phosphatase 1 n=1 Tax=Geothermobacter ehrlichii TaxID=213224 RepID=A0A5D3WKM0_9BACT|nr:metallophosphoesterase family protein [Geothermobacter ehrlichii]TYO98942.1 serine/threonine protein phosphatase 1 [Geothermobacter ehrlichii]
MEQKDVGLRFQGGRLLAVGDIHGCHELLLRLLAEVRPRPDDRLIFLGDYIDRGRDSRQVIETLLELRKRLPATVFLRGNHEQMLLDYLDGHERLLFLANGGATTLASYRHRGVPQIPQSHRDFFRALPCLHREAGFIFVHAGLRPGIPVAEQREEDLLWIRQEFIASDEDFGATVVFGHTPQTAPLLRTGRIGLDTGAVYGGLLSCCDVLSGRTWSVG